MMQDRDFETLFLVNETQAPICISYSDRKSFVVYAKDVREIKKTTWKAACKRSPQLLDQVKAGDLRTLMMPEDVNEILKIVEKLDNLGKAKQMEIERMSPEDAALAFQQKRKADYDSYGNPHVVAASKEIV
jgi:pantothenate kinase